MRGLGAVPAGAAGTAIISPLSGSDELRVQGDLRLEELRYRTILLRIGRQPGERLRIEIRHLGAQRERGLADLEPLTLGLQRDRGLGGELGGRVAGPLENEGERHGEAAGVSSRDQLLRIRPLLALEAGLEGIRGRGQDTGIAGQLALARAAGAAPDRFGFTDHGGLLGIGNSTHITTVVRVRRLPSRSSAYLDSTYVLDGE